MIKTEQEFLTRYSFNYQTDELGGGAFGKVYKAYDNVLDKYYALKIADHVTYGDKTFSLADEFLALEKLADHPNVAKYENLHTFETHRGKVDYALMQYYPDGNLSHLINSGKLNAELKETIALQLLEGISFLHQNKVVHRDMKPSNILVHYRNNDGKYIPKITDFGLSKKAKTNKGTHFTNSIAAGTYAYSSPEQLKGEELRFNTDLWAYGAIVYELFTGKTMFNIQKTSTGSSAIEVQEILDNILKNDITTKVKELPEKWQPVATACLERDAQKRVKTADAVLDILHSKTQAQPIEEPISTAKTTNTPETQILEKPTPQKMAKTQVLGKEPSEVLVQTQKNDVKNTSLWVLLSMLGLALVMAWIFWPKKQKEKPMATTAVVADSTATNATANKVDTLATASNASTIAETDWKKEFETKFAALQATEKQNTAEVNIKRYKALLASLPSDAKNEKHKVTKIIESFSNSKPSSTTVSETSQISETKTDPNWRKYYDKIYPFKEGLAMVKKNDKYGYVDKEGKLIIPLIYYGGRDFSEGLALVLKKNLKRGYIDKNNKIIIPMIYDDGVDFENGLVRVNYQGNYYTINKKGECVKDCPN